MTDEVSFEMAHCPICGLALLLMLSGCAARHAGPWDLPALTRPPRMEWGDQRGPVRGLYYEGEPYAGHGTRVFAYYGAPDDVTDKVPAMVLVHGGGGEAFAEWVELWVRRGYAAMAMDLSGRGPDGERLPDGGPDQGDAREIEKFHHIARGVKEAWPYHAVANVIRAHSLLRTLPEVAPGRIGITGISWGGYVTCIVAGLDDRFRLAVPVYACGFLHENSEWLKTFARMSPRHRQLWIDNYDPSRYLPDCRMPILFVTGTNDLAYPLDSHQKSYRLVRGPRTLCVTVGMPHSHPAGWAPKEIGIFADSVLRDGKPLARFENVSRHGRDVIARFEAAVPVKEAALHYTTDVGPWAEREWHTLPARIQDGHVQAKLPPETEKGIVYFLTVTDERGAVVSTEHDSEG